MTELSLQPTPAEDETLLEVNPDNYAGTLQATTAALAAVLETAKLRAKRKPPRTHYNCDGRVSLVERAWSAEPVEIVHKAPACGQLNGTKTDKAQTNYTLDPDEVNCMRCAKTKAFIAALVRKDLAISEAEMAEAAREAEAA